MAGAGDKGMTFSEAGPVPGQGPIAQQMFGYWFAQPGAPRARLANERPAPQTVDYDQLIMSWK